MSDIRRNSEDALSASSCPTSSRAAQRVASAMQHRRSESASTTATITPPTITRRHPYTSSPPPLDTSFDADSDVSGPSTRPSSWNIPQHNQQGVSPEASTPSTRSRSTSPVSRLPYPLTSNTPDRSISSVLESSRRWNSPQTPQTPGAGSSVPSTTSPVSRAKPRFKHSSSDTPLHKSTDSSNQPVQVLPFPLTAMQDKYQQNGGPKVARVRFSDAHPRSMPKLSAATFAPPSPVRANTSPSMLLAANESQSSRSRSDSANRRRSAQASSMAAATPGTESWQRKVAEEMIRLSFAPAVSTANPNASNTSSLSSATGKRNSRHSTGTRSSGEFQQLNLDPRLAKLNHPTAAPKVDAPPVPFPSSGVPMKQINAKPRTRPTRSNTTPSPKKLPFEAAVATSKDKENEVHRRRKLSSLIRNAAAASAEPVEVRVVKQESFEHPDAIGINAQQWKLEVDVPTSSLGIPVPSTSEDKVAGPSTTRKLDDEGVAGDDEPVLKPRPRQTRRSVRSRNSSGARSVGAARAATAAAANSSTPDITEGVAVQATGNGNGNARKSTGSSGPSLNTRLNALRQSSQNTLQQSPASSSHVPSSPDDSPTPSRRRLSSYVIEPTALFFAPRAHPPPPDEEAMNDNDEQRDRGRMPRISTSGLAPPRQSSGSMLDRQSTTSASVVPSSRPTSSYVTAPQSAISTPHPSNSTSRAPSLREQPPAAKEESVTKGKGKRVFDDMDPEVVQQQPGASGSVEGGVHHLGNGLVMPPRQRLESNMTRYTDDDTIGELPQNNNPSKRLKMSSSAHIVQTLSEAVAAQSSPDSSYEQQQQQPSPSDQVPRGILNKSPGPGSATEGGGGPSRPSSRRSQSVSFTLQAGSTRDGARSPSLASTRGGRRPLSVGSRPISLSSGGGGGKSIPLMAIISPRPASFVNPPPSSSNGGYHHQYHLREPRRYSGASASSRPPQATSPSVSTRQQMSPTSPQYSMSYVQSMRSVNPESPVDEENSGVQVAHGQSRDLPFQGWAFFVGFLVPFAWWIASFTRVDYDAYARDAEAGVESRFPPMEIITWRRRCRLMSVFSIIVYIPVIVLAVVFGR